MKFRNLYKLIINKFKIILLFQQKFAILCVHSLKFGRNELVIKNI